MHRTNLCGNILYIQHHFVGKSIECCIYLFDVRIVGNINKWDRIGNQPTIFLQIGQVTQTFHRFQRDDQVGRTKWNQIGCNGFVADAKVGLNIATPLTHPVYFGLLHVKAIVKCCFTNNSCNREDTLSTYA